MEALIVIVRVRRNNFVQHTLYEVIRLLKKAEELALENGYKKLSLGVEFYNKEAKRIYEKFGFHETDKVEFPQKYHKYSIDGFYKMVKVLSE